MRCQIINVGDELLTGQVINTNAAGIGQMLLGVGIRTEAVHTIPDVTYDIISCLKTAWQSADLIILTGGLGPTRDDVTKTALVSFFGVDLIFSEATYARLVKLFQRFGKEVTEAHRAQCFLPSNAILLTNDRGTAPGMYFEQGDKHLFVLPGVPHEMVHLMETRVMPLVEKLGSRDAVLVYKTLCTVGVGESQLALELADIENAMPGHIHIAYLPRPGLVRLRIVWNGQPASDLHEKLEWWTQVVLSRIHSHVYATTDIPLAEVLGHWLRDRGETLCVAESCTGGYLGHMITMIPGSSDYFNGGAITYSNRMKTQLLGVQEETLITHGAVSEETAREMASGARSAFGSDLALAVTGIAGPGGGSDQKPVGTVWIAVAGENSINAMKFQFGKDRERNIELSAVAALNMLRKFLYGTS